MSGRITGKTSRASTGSTYKLPAWKLRPCPTCEAKPGQPCTRAVWGRVQGVNLGVWFRPMKGPHRKRKEAPTVDGGA